MGPQSGSEAGRSTVEDSTGPPAQACRSPGPPTRQAAQGDGMQPWDGLDLVSIPLYMPFDCLNVHISATWSLEYFLRSLGRRARCSRQQRQHSDKPRPSQKHAQHWRLSRKLSSMPAKEHRSWRQQSGNSCLSNYDTAPAHVYISRTRRGHYHRCPLPSWLFSVQVLRV